MVNKGHLSIYIYLSLPLSRTRCTPGRGWRYPHCPRPRDGIDPPSLSRSLVIGDGAIAVTVAAVETRHTHSTLHIMRGGDGRLLSRVRRSTTWTRRPSHHGAAVSPSSSSASFECRGARYESRYGQSRAIRISRRSIRDSRDLYRRPLHVFKM